MADYNTALAEAQALLAAVAPQLTQTNTSFINRLLGTFVSTDAETNIALADSAPNIAYTTAQGPALVAKAADANVFPSAGTEATDWVVLYVTKTSVGGYFIPAGTIVGTGNNGSSSPQVNFATQDDVTISGLPVNGTAVVANYAVRVAVTCTQTGSAGNVGPGAITWSSLASQGIQVTNDTSYTTPVGTLSNPNGGNHASGSPNVTGTDADTPAQLVNKIAAKSTSPSSLQAALSAMLAVPGVYDALIVDGGNATGYLYYYWCMVDGSAPGIPVTNTVVASGDADNTNYSQLAGGTGLSGTALLVDNAIRTAVQFAIPRIGAAGSATSPFLVDYITALSITYSAPATVQSSVVEPQMTTAILAYIQSLVHGQVPTTIGMYNAITQGIPNVLAPVLDTSTITNFSLTGSTPFIGSPSPTTIYRCISATITYTRV